MSQNDLNSCASDLSWNLCGSEISYASDSSDSSWEFCTTDGSKASCDQRQGSEVDTESVLSYDLTFWDDFYFGLDIHEEDFWDKKSSNPKFFEPGSRRNQTRRGPKVRKPSMLLIDLPLDGAVTDFDDIAQGSCNKKGRWNLPKVLEKNAASVQRPLLAQWRRREGHCLVRFQVPVTGVRKSLALDTKGPSTSQVDEKILVFRKDAKGKYKVDGSFPTEAPKHLLQDNGIMEYKSARYRAPRGAAQTCDPTTAACRNNSSLSFFAPSDPQRGKQHQLSRRANQCLEVDLGKSVDVTHFAVAGRFPNTRLEYVEELGSLQQLVQAADVGRPWFFEAYEVSFRVGPGKPWIRLGKFVGPAHNYDVKVQALEYGGLKCRFLRFVPIVKAHDDFSISRGFRVSVFGTTDTTNSEHEEKKEVLDPSMATITLESFDGPTWGQANRKSCPCCCSFFPKPRSTRKRELLREMKHSMY